MEGTSKVAYRELLLQIKIVAGGFGDENIEAGAV